MGTPDLSFILTNNNNNKSETVFQLFEKAIHEYGVPDRIRTDKGGENIKVKLHGGGIHS